MTVLATTALTSSFDVFRDEGDERIRGLAKWLRGISVAVSDTRKQNERHDEDWALSFTWDKNKYQTGDY
ncbi:hypothetical protein [Schaalia vaccimaxillae]|uniref:hypothetical protein n=1 Tax=Schaalia vaccimaxillae TaxID=183916 RepID=UPI0013F422BD|nr:hypothetical protein [Schaalia vaccimaxillae]